MNILSSILTDNLPIYSLLIVILLLASGDGNFHVLLMLRPGVPEDIAEAHRLAGDIALLAIEMGGTCTGEHGECTVFIVAG